MNYEKLLERLYNNLEGWSNEKTIIQQPHVSHQPHKTYIHNFSILSQCINRDNEHLKTFLVNELATPASIDSSGQCLIRGKFSSKAIMSCISKYVRTYCLCLSCNGINTYLSKENRLTICKCYQCGATRNVV